ncbi:hypothetical protein JXI42_12030 [bacterium]|nr:hypothetical protein [bacterium]
MKEIYKLKSIILIILVGLIPLFIGCPLFEDDEPEEGDQNFTLIAEETIGTSGGVIYADSFEIDIPAGAFSQDFDLKIYASTEDKPFGDYVNTSVFMVEGIPEGFTQPIKFTIRYHGVLSGDTLGAIGQNMFAPSLYDTTTAYYAPAATDSSGYLLFEFAATAASAKEGFILDSTLTLPPIIIFGIRDHIVKNSANGHFRIVLPTSYQPDAATVAAFFEAAYDTFQNMGFSYTRRTRWPLNVTVKSINAVGEYTGRLNDKNSGVININTGDMGDLAEIRVTAAHEFFHMVQHLYNFQFSDDIWLAEAFSVWCEDKVDLVTNYISSSLGGNEMEPFYGWQIAAQDHGYGMSVVMKDLVEVYGESSVREVFNYIDAGPAPVSPVDAVLHSVTEPVGNMWHGFLGSYILGHYFNDQVRNIILDNLGNFTDFFIINGAADTLATFTDSYQDLSGKLYAVELNYTGILPGASLLFTLSDPTNCGLAVFKLKVGADSTALLDEVFPGGSGTIAIPNVSELAAGGWRLIALVSNSRHVAPYTGNTSISLEAKLTGSSPGTITRGYIWARLNNHLLYGDSLIISYWGSDDKDTVVLSSSGIEMLGYGYGGEFQSASGSNFSGSSDEILGEIFRYRLIQNYSITVDDTLGSILSFNGNSSSSLQSFPGYPPSTSSISGNNILLSRSSITRDTLIFRVEGSEVCDHITSLSYNGHNPIWEVPYEPHAVDTTWNRFSTVMTDYDCDTTDCFIQIMLIAE